MHLNDLFSFKSAFLLSQFQIQGDDLTKNLSFSSNYHHIVWNNEKFTLTEKIFRQINSLVISLVNTLLSRNFFQKCVRVNFRNYHTHCGILPSLEKYFVKTAWLKESSILQLISRNFSKKSYCDFSTTVQLFRYLFWIDEYSIALLYVEFVMRVNLTKFTIRNTVPLYLFHICTDERTYLQLHFVVLISFCFSSFYFNEKINAPFLNHQ